MGVQDRDWYRERKTPWQTVGGVGLAHRRTGSMLLAVLISAVVTVGLWKLHARIPLHFPGQTRHTTCTRTTQVLPSGARRITTRCVTK